MNLPKPFWTLGSMALFIWVIAAFTDFWFAVGITLMLFIHELGHLIAIWKKGYPVSWPIFIPMLGAMIKIPKIKNSEEEAYIGYGGPFLGSLAAITGFIIWKHLPNPEPTLLKVCFWGVFLNLFNLLPIRPLDGGRIAQAISPWFKYIGLAAVVFFAVYAKSFIFVLILMMAFMEENFRLNPPVKLPGRQRIKWALLYFGLAGILTYLMVLQFPLIAPLLKTP